MAALGVGLEGTGTGAGAGVEFPGTLLEVDCPPELVPVFEPDVALVAVTAEPAEKGFAPPDPQPTTDAMASKAAPNLIDTLDIECNLNPCALRMQLTEITVGLHLLWLYRRGAVGEVEKIPRLY
jgi:hypothetical protein